MIKNNTIVSMSESVKYLGKDEKHTELKGFVKKFVKLEPAAAIKLGKELEGLGLMKIREEHVAKIVDFLPEKEEVRRHTFLF